MIHALDMFESSTGIPLINMITVLLYIILYDMLRVGIIISIRNPPRLSSTNSLIEIRVEILPDIIYINDHFFQPFPDDVYTC